MADYNVSNAKQQVLKALLVAIFMQGCTSATNVSLDKIYRKEVEINVDGSKAKGVYVAPRRTLYKVRFELPDKPNVVKITTCHRDETFRDVGKKLEYEYKPVIGIEDSGSCLFEMGAFDDTGANLWGMIDFEDTETLPAIVHCNGELIKANGASICQSKAGLIQAVSFSVHVEVFQKDNCPKMESEDKMTYVYSMARNKCIYLFFDGTDQHRHTTFGYDEVLIK